MKMQFVLISLLTILPSINANAADDDLTQSSPDARVYIVSPANGAHLSSPVTVIFGLSNMGVAPAGIDKQGTGHHHLLVDHPLPPLDEAMTVEDGLLHFGGGQTETTIELAPGSHNLQLILGDQYHIPHKPPVISESITINIDE